MPGRDLLTSRPAALTVGPVLHLGGGQLRVLGQQPGQAEQVAAVEDVAAFHLELDPGPAGEPVFAGQRQLRGGQDDPARDRADPRDRAGAAALGGAQKVPGLVAELVQVGPGRQVRHDVSVVTPWSAPGPEETVITNGLVLDRGGGLCPARGPSGALQRPALIVSPLAVAYLMSTFPGTWRQCCGLAPGTRRAGLLESAWRVALITRGPALRG